MSKLTWKPGTMVYPVPAVMVSCGNKEIGENIITIAWTGTVCTNPPMCYISVRKQRHSYDLIKNTGEFVINLTTKDLVKATDYCGVKSGRDVDKFKEMNLTSMPATKVSSPMIKESPLNIECKVTEIKELGSHDMILAEVVAVNVDEDLIDENGRLHLDWSNPIAYSHGTYYDLKSQLGTFGYSIRKKPLAKKGDSKKATNRSTLKQTSGKNNAEDKVTNSSSNSNTPIKAKKNRRRHQKNNRKNKI
ncbi:MAG: flavin reductase family protein [Acidaminobacteraceae bacterium]